MARTTPSGDKDRDDKQRRLRIIVGVAVALGIMTSGPSLVFDYYADQRADAFEAELAAAAARIPDRALAGLAAQHLIASYEPGGPDPLLEALGQRHADGTVWWKGDGTVSLSFEVSWGVEDRCVRLLLRPGRPPRTDTTRSPSCQALVP